MKNNQTVYWTAFYTKPRTEKKVAERLESKGYEIYCPIRMVMKQWSDRKKKVKQPFFTSYVFARVDESIRSEILMDAGIVSNVFWLGKPAVIRDEEINELKLFLEEFPTAQVGYGRFNEGDRIEINSGPLSGHDGTISRIQRNKAYLAIVSLGIEVRAEINLGSLNKVN